MRLEAHAVDRDAACLEVPDHVVDGIALRVDAVRVVVVVAELGRGIGGPGGAERLLDEAVAELNSVLSVEAYADSPRWFAATAAPK
ncbi:hypothetical protein GCM10010094_61150 [Streptomyces flaveus]|uniref:Uncharacterized protein n=1 Tax=Streptomyces flaveus TaxID=66370 RepID=A0A917VKX7_9ACTN|nr:hypothetical protein GCM10010094_61150 [Streptomyces flaveus]